MLLTGLSGLLAGALSMGAGEFVSVRSQRELLAASVPDTRDAASGCRASTSTPTSWRWSTAPAAWSAVEADRRAREVLGSDDPAGTASAAAAGVDEGHEVVGSSLAAALSSFCFFASGAAIPVLPFLFGLPELVALVVAGVLVGLALMLTGATVGVLSGGPPLRRALRQLAIGLGRRP